MTTALIVTTPLPGDASLPADLAGVGIHVLGAVERGNLVQEAIRLAPDVVICHEAWPDAALFESCALLTATAPRPLIVFTRDPDADKIDQALRAGVNAYVINGYAANRLRSVVHVAQARFAHERRLRESLDEVTHRFEERKLVDRAKGILMRARQLSEEEAFRVLRTASMHSKRRVGQVSQQVIDAARYAEAVNRAGQLRMLSQRLVKLQALRVLGRDPARTEAQFAEAVQRVEANLAMLGKGVSQSTYGDLLEGAMVAWRALRSGLRTPVDAARLADVDACAERFLERADRLTASLENSGLVTTLEVINVAGRQRMWSQRLAKQALLSVLLVEPAAGQARDDARRTAAALDEALAYLEGLPLSTREIRQLLETARSSARHLLDAAAQAATPDGPRALADASDAVLEVFEHLTDQYERSMQVLMG